MGQITKRYKRRGVYYYDVMTERNIALEGLTVNAAMPVYVVEHLSEQLKNREKC